MGHLSRYVVTIAAKVAPIRCQIIKYPSSYSELNFLDILISFDTTFQISE